MRILCASPEGQLQTCHGILAVLNDDPNHSSFKSYDVVNDTMNFSERPLLDSPQPWYTNYIL